MTRNEMIKALIEDRLTDWVYAQNIDGLEDILISGWKGYEDYTDLELKEAFEELSNENLVKKETNIEAKMLDIGINKEDN